MFAMNLGIFVPDQVSVIGGDEDDLLCEAGHPPLTGVETPSEQIGLEAAELLDRLMRGESSPTEPRYIPPTGVIARQSTDILAIEDPDLVGAVRFIRNNPEKQIQVDDVVNAVHVSRRSLERRFAVAFNRSIREEITRVHLQRAKMLLAQTEMAIPAVADASGHGSPEYFATSFKAATGTTPLKYRGPRSWSTITSDENVNPHSDVVWAAKYLNRALAILGKSSRHICMR